MAIISAGYDGTVDEVQFAKMLPRAGASEYGVDGSGDFNVRAVAGQDRTVSVSPGTAWGHSVVDVMDANQTVQLGTIASGSRWDLIVLRRDWRPPGGATTVQVIKGGTAFTLPARSTSPGVLDDQPLALVQVTAGKTQPTQVIDLRVWARNGGLTANHDKVREYLNPLGTVVEVNGITWRRKPGDNNAPKWVDEDKVNDTGWQHTGIFLPAAKAFWRIDSYALRRKKTDVLAVLNVTYRGPAITAQANDVQFTRGNFQDVKITELPGGYRPAYQWPIEIEKPNTQKWFGSLFTNGSVVLTSGLPGAVLEPGDSLRVTINCPLD